LVERLVAIERHRRGGASALHERPVCWRCGVIEKRPILHEFRVQAAIVRMIDLLGLQSGNSGLTLPEGVAASMVMVGPAARGDTATRTRTSRSITPQLRFMAPDRDEAAGLRQRL
jgi:hypothetical protein